jgi:hypothetical protein
MTDTFSYVYWYVGGGVILLALLVSYYVWNFCCNKCKQ